MPLSLTLQPAQTELISKPGITITQAYTITNNSATSAILTTEVLPWAPSGTNGAVSYDSITPNPNLEFSLSNSDLSLGQKFILKPGENRQLVLKIKSTTNIPSADSYYTFFVSQDLSNTINAHTTQSNASARIGSHLLLSISNSESTPSQLSLSQFSVNPQIKDIFFSTLNIQAQINNHGSYYSKPTGKIIITKNNLTINELNIFPSNILANSSRNLMCNQNNEPVPCTLSPPFWPGIYTATIQINNETAQSATFFVLPYILLSIFIFTFLTLLIIKHKFIHTHES